MSCTLQCDFCPTRPITCLPVGCFWTAIRPRVSGTRASYSFLHPAYAASHQSTRLHGVLLEPSAARAAKRRTSCRCSSERGASGIYLDARASAGCRKWKWEQCTTAHQGRLHGLPQAQDPLQQARRRSTMHKMREVQPRVPVQGACSVS